MALAYESEGHGYPEIGDRVAVFKRTFLAEPDSDPPSQIKSEYFEGYLQTAPHSNGDHFSVRPSDDRGPHRIFRLGTVQSPEESCKTGLEGVSRSFASRTSSLIVETILEGLQ